MPRPRRDPMTATLEPEVADADMLLGPPTRRELRVLAADMGVDEARYLVDLFYQMQRQRIANGNEQRALTTAGEPSAVVGWVSRATASIEADIKAAMEVFCATDPLAAWALEIVGIGPILAAGLVANLDRDPPPTVGHWWAFAGLMPPDKMVWEKGQKRPYSARLKLLCWKIGESFVRTKGNPRSQYGPFYEQRKAYEVARNESGGNAEAAALRLATQAIESPELRACLEAGKLPPGQMDQRARRWAVKLFLAHFHGEAWRQRYGTEPPLPYPVAHLGHAHVIPAPASSASAAAARARPVHRARAKQTA